MKRRSSSLPAKNRYLIIAGAVLLTTALLYVLLGRELVESIYYGRIPVLSDMLQGRSTQPIDFYLHVFNKLGLAALAIEILALLSFGIAAGRIELSPGHHEWPALAAVLAATALTLGLYQAASTPVTFAGDASEYFQMTQSFASHGTPDLRLTDEAAFARERLDRSVPGSPPLNGYWKSPVDGRWYSVHFWLFPLFGLPFRALLQLLGLPWMKAFEMLNIIAFFTSITVLLLYAKMKPARRALLASVLVLSPVIWYLPWPSPEVLTASLVIFSITAFTRRQCALAVLLAAMASTQNQPLLLLAAAYFAYAGMELVRQRRYRSLALCAGAGLPALAPMAFYGATFHMLSPLAAAFTGWDNVSMSRLVGFFFDLDQGLLPYLPLVTIGFFVSLGAGLLRRSWWVVARVLVVFGMVVLSATTARGWNSAAMGLMRYGVWMLPVIAWVVADTLPSTRRGAFALATLLTVQLAVLLGSHAVSMPGQDNHSLPERLVLAHAPALVSPPAEEFTERTLGTAVSAQEFQPIAFLQGQFATTILADKAHFASLANYYETDPGLAASLKLHRADSPGFWYANLRVGQARQRQQETAVASIFYSMDATVGGPTSLGPSDEKAAADEFNRFPASSTGEVVLSPYAVYPLYVRVMNSSTSTWYPGGSRELGIATEVLDLTGGSSSASQPAYTPLLQLVRPGDTATFYPTFMTPLRAARYRLHITVVQKDAQGTEVAVADTVTEVPFAVEIAPPLKR